MESLQKQLETVSQEEREFKKTNWRANRASKGSTISLYTLWLLGFIAAIIISLSIWRKSGYHEHPIGAGIFHILGTVWYYLIGMGVATAILTEPITSLFGKKFKVSQNDYNQFERSIASFNQRKVSIKKQINDFTKQTPSYDISEDNVVNVEHPVLPDLIETKEQKNACKTLNPYSPPPPKKLTYNPVTDQEENKVSKSSSTELLTTKENYHTEEKAAEELFGRNKKQPKPTERRTNTREDSTKKIDFVTLHAKWKSIGEGGELFIFEREKKKLFERGKIKLSNQVIHISQKDDSKGYDIISFNEHGDIKYIEVKTTTGSQVEPFYLSANEMQAMKVLPNYWIYRVFNFNLETGKGEFYKIDCSNNLDEYYEIVGSTFKVSPR